METLLKIVYNCCKQTTVEKIDVKPFGVLRAKCSLNVRHATVWSSLQDFHSCSWKNKKRTDEKFGVCFWEDWNEWSVLCSVALKQTYSSTLKLIPNRAKFHQTPELTLKNELVVTLWTSPGKMSTYYLHANVIETTDSTSDCGENNTVIQVRMKVLFVM